MQKSIRVFKIKVISLLIISTLIIDNAVASNISDIDFGQNKSGKFELQLLGDNFNGVTSFNTTNPARIIIDIPNAKSLLKEKVKKINVGDINDVVVVEGENKTRVTIDLSSMIPYDIKTTGTIISIILDKELVGSGKFQVDKTLIKQSASKIKEYAKVDFSSGKDGRGIVSIILPNKSDSVDIRREGTKIKAVLSGSKISDSDRKRLNVLDFNTPVSNVDLTNDMVEVSMSNSDFEFISYQTDHGVIIEFSKSSDEESSADSQITLGLNKKYNGEPISLNFQDIEVRSVLQLIADFTNKNIVVSDDVSGSITLRLNSVPSDQAMDIILKTKGLSKREKNNVLYVSTTQKLYDSESVERKLIIDAEENSPLQTELVQIQFARAESLKILIVENSANIESKSNGFLSARGSISVDPRTNTIMIQDVASHIDSIRGLISKLDVPVNQVLIDSKIVVAADNFAHQLGVQLGGAFIGNVGNSAIAGSGKLNGTDSILQNVQNNLTNTGQFGPVTPPSLNDRLGVSLPATGSGGSFGIGILGADFMLDLELSASQADNRSETISSPRVITQDGMEATIKQGQEIPYTTRDQDGFATTSFKEANLELVVTPKIAPNRMIDMILKVTKNAQAGTASNTDSAIPIINTNEVSTQVLVKDGETIVLGGVFEQLKAKDTTKVPLLGDIPVVGRLFRRDVSTLNKSELLIFVTPKIVDKRFVENDKFSSFKKLI